MTVFRFRNDSPVIPRPLHNSATRRLTTLPIELINDQRVMSVAGYKNAKYPPSRGKRKKTHNIAETVQHKTSLHFSIDRCQQLRRDMLILCVVPKSLTKTSRVKWRQEYRDAQSHVFSRFPPLSTRQQRYQGHESFRRVQKKTHRDQEKRVFSSKLPTPRVTFDTPKPDARTTFNKDGEKHGQREILESRDIRQVPNKRRVEVQSQNRDSLIRDVDVICISYA